MVQQNTLANLLPDLARDLHHADVIADVGDAVVVARLSNQYAVARPQAVVCLEPLSKQLKLAVRLAVDHADAEGGEGDEGLAGCVQGPGVHNVDSLGVCDHELGARVVQHGLQRAHEAGALRLHLDGVAAAGAGEVHAVADSGGPVPDGLLLHQRLGPQQPHAGGLSVHGYVHEDERVLPEGPLGQTLALRPLLAVGGSILQEVGHGGADVLPCVMQVNVHDWVLLQGVQHLTHC
mmetsp:Transcript_18985/g.40890  ORF Transcript_18985/g.40890 Transcript_18985/m.40890 type:complete len:235 (+) Transcript_18985:1041-1745(+)